MKFILLMILSFSSNGFSFVLNDPNYRLANPEKTTVNIANGACRGNGMSDDTLRSAISEAIRYWNSVTESRLRLRLGDEVSRGINGGTERGEILIGCLSIPGDAGGFANIYPNSGSGRVVLDADIFIPGGYTYDGLVGILTHEIGHTLGLGHSGDPASVMTYEDNNWGPKAKYLSQDDKDGIIYLYPNEGEAGGLLGSCTVDASPNKLNKQNIYGANKLLNALIELLLFFAFVYSLRHIGRFIRKRM